MFDLETLGSDSGDIIVQIGACYFDRDTGEIGKTFSRNMDMIESHRLGFTHSMDTVKWWLWQSKEAQKSVFEGQMTPVITALIDFSIFCKGLDTAWSHSTFDQVLLFAYYKKLGLEIPFHYKNGSDLRTITKLVKIDLKTRERKGVHHNGVDDCIFQVGYTVECLKALNQK
jgi:hypothetical protein